MNHYEIFKAISAEYPEHIALAAVQIYTVNLTIKLRFDQKLKQKIIKKANKLLWEMSENERELSIKIWDVIYSWQARQALQGMGGCVAKTFKQLVLENGDVT